MKFLSTYFEEHLRTAPFKLTLESDCLELCFRTAAFKTILTGNITNIPVAFKSAVETQFYAYVVFIFKLALLFESRFRMFIINGYYTKKQTIVVLGLLVLFGSCLGLTMVSALSEISDVNDKCFKVYTDVHN